MRPSRGAFAKITSKNESAGGAGGRTLQGRGGACAQMTRDPERSREALVTVPTYRGQGTVHAHALAHRTSRCPSYELDLHSGAPPKQVRLAPWKIPLTGELGTVDDPDDGPDTSSTQAREDPLPRLCM